MSLARLWRDQGKRKIAPLNNWFTKGTRSI